ncbi:MAG: 4-hydroxyphenylpyruvate dioxygenase [Candidatus Sericytochromatia bacterium]|nr:4-hydroxyphenylpyruvate dioxygenase [Candidatus Sericytochromatia bacterium]
MTETTSQPLSTTEAADLQAFDHVEFWVGNAKQAAYFYTRAFGFRCVAYAGPETGVKDRASYVLRQNDIVLVFTCSLQPEGPVADHVRLHGDGVRDVAFRVQDVDAAFAALVARGARPAVEPHTLEGAGGQVRRASVHTYGDTLHSLIGRDDFAGPFLPGFEAREPIAAVPGGLGRIDHIVGNVGWNEMNPMVEHYVNVFGFHPFVSFDDKDISTEFTALRSVVVANPRETIKMPINEPAEGKKRSQIEEYIDFYRGPGVQHLALTTADIVETVSRLRDAGVEFLLPPEAYYEQLAERLVGVDFHEDIERLKPLGILVDHDEKGYLLQIFTKPMTDRPTLFFEIIQRKGSDSFGKGNFKALFEAIEAEQARRGTL